MAVVTAYDYVWSDSGGSGGAIGLDLENLSFEGSLRLGRVVEATPDRYTIETYNNPITFIMKRFEGADLGYDASGRLVGGTVTGWETSIKYEVDRAGPGGVLAPDHYEEQKLVSVTGLSVPATTFAGWIEAGGASPAPRLLDGDDSITGSSTSDVLLGYAGNDTIDGEGSGFSTSDADQLRGGDGNDLVRGGAGFDDINGNMGDDTASGDAGNDTVRGGQGDDCVAGGVGEDWLSGDLGADTLSGGAGADIFHSFGEAGVDRVTDFNRGEGDRVMLDAGGAYTVAQVGADTVITLGGGAQVILVGVQLSTLGGDWIFTG